MRAYRKAAAGCALLLALATAGCAGQDDGGTVLTVREDHTGPLAGLLDRSTPDLNPSFRQFCAGLKARAEGKVSRPAG